MEPQTTKAPLTTQPWFVDLMAANGFQPSQPGTFSNGKATVQIRGTRLIAAPGDGGKRWVSDIGGANRETLTVVISQLLKMRPFLSDAQLALERSRRGLCVQALDGIAESIRQSPDTGGGVQLRKVLWSLYNQHHLVNLWRVTAALDSQHAAWVAEVVGGMLAGHLKEDDLKRALAASGEMNRWDREQPGTEAQRKLQAAQDIVTELARATLPSRAHTEITDLLRQFGGTSRIFREENLK